MEKALKEFLNSLLLKRQKCPWGRNRALSSQVEELEKEVAELKQAIGKNQAAEIMEEFGDVFWDLLFVGLLAEEKGLFTMKQAIEEAHAKLKRRTPWVFGNECISTEAEAVKRWNEIKEQEKSNKHN